MDLKFYLNKFIKVDNIEHYTLGSLNEIRKKYDSFLEKSEGLDPDFPMISFGGSGKGKKIGGVNKQQALAGLGGDIEDLLNF